MSDKKPDFDSLDFSEVTNPPAEEKQKVQIPEASTVKKKKAILNNATWLFGKEIEEVTPAEMKEWALSLVGVELDEQAVSSPKKRSLLIDKIVWIHSNLKFLGVTQAFNKDTRTYQN